MTALNGDESRSDEALAIFNAMIAQIMSQSRLFFSLGRDAVFHGAINQILAKVDRVSGVPRAATLVVVALSAPCRLLAVGRRNSGTAAHAIRIEIFFRKIQPGPHLNPLYKKNDVLDCG
jgi:hypothetical protein